MKSSLVRTGGALLLLGVGFVGGCVFVGSLQWVGKGYFVGANRQMVAIAAAAAEDRDPRQCLLLLEEYYDRAAKYPWGVGYVNRNLVEFQQAIWKLDEVPASTAEPPRR